MDIVIAARLHYGRMDNVERKGEREREAGDYSLNFRRV